MSAVAKVGERGSAGVIAGGGAIILAEAVVGVVNESMVGEWSADEEEGQRGSRGGSSPEPGNPAHQSGARG